MVCDPETNPNCYVRIRLDEHPPELPANQTVISLQRLTNWNLGDPPECTDFQGQTVPGIFSRQGRPSTVQNEVFRFDLEAPATPCGFGYPFIFTTCPGVCPSTFIGGDEDNVLVGGAGNDVFDADIGADRLTGGRGNDILIGGLGNDELFGGLGIDLILGGAGNDLLESTLGAEESGLNRLLGGLGNDILRFFTDFDNRVLEEVQAILDAGPGNDRVEGSSLREVIRGGLGDDILIGNGGNDLIFTDGFESGNLSGSSASVRRVSKNQLYSFRARRRRKTRLIVPDRGSDEIHGGEEPSVILLRRGDASPAKPEQIFGGSGTDVLWGNGVHIPAEFPVLIRSANGSILSPQSTMGTITDPLTGGVFVVEGISDFREASILAQIGNGEGLVSELLYTNPSASRTVSVNVSFSNGEGEDLELPFKGQGTSAEFEFDVPPLGSRTLTTTGKGKLVAGAAQTSSTGPVGSTVRFALENLGVTGVPESFLLDSFLLPVTRDLSSGLSTGFAVFNFGEQDTLKIRLNNLDGTMADSTDVPIAAEGHLSVFVHEIFEIGDFVGTMRIDGSPLAATAIQQGSQAGQFTTLPVVPVLPAPAAETLFFSQFGNGGGFDSSVFLLNPSATEDATGQLEFFDDDGNQLELSMNGQPAASNVPFNIAPGGGAVFTTDGQGDVVVGSARATLGGGVLGGVLRFFVPSAGLAGVGASAPIQNAIIAVRRSVANDLSTGVAVASTGEAVTLNCVLRDTEGNPVPDGTGQISLAANGHLSRFIQELFPDAETSQFNGVLTIGAQEGGEFAATAIEFGGGRFTTIPVTPLMP